MPDTLTSSHTVARRSGPFDFVIIPGCRRLCFPPAGPPHHQCPALAARGSGLCALVPIHLPFFSPATERCDRLKGVPGSVCNSWLSPLNFLLHRWMGSVCAPPPSWKAEAESQSEHQVDEKCHEKCVLKVALCNGGEWLQNYNTQNCLPHRREGHKSFPGQFGEDWNLLQEEAELLVVGETECRPTAAAVSVPTPERTQTCC